MVSVSSQPSVRAIPPSACAMPCSRRSCAALSSSIIDGQRVFQRNRCRPDRRAVVQFIDQCGDAALRDRVRIERHGVEAVSETSLTVRVALAPGVVTGRSGVRSPDMVSSAPARCACRSTEIVQLCPASTVPSVSDTMPSPAAAFSVPPQVVAALGATRHNQAIREIIGEGQRSHRDQVGLVVDGEGQCRDTARIDRGRGERLGKDRCIRGIDRQRCFSGGRRGDARCQGDFPAGQRSRLDGAYRHPDLAGGARGKRAAREAERRGARNRAERTAATVAGAGGVGDRNPRGQRIVKHHLRHRDGIASVVDRKAPTAMALAVLSMVKVSVEIPVGSTVSGENALAKPGAAAGVTVSRAMAPGTTSGRKDFRSPDMFSNVPTRNPSTSTETVQVSLAATTPPVKLNVGAPASGVKLPPQLVSALGVPATISPGGRTSSKASAPDR